MNDVDVHVPVLVDEVMTMLAPAPGSQIGRAHV